MSSHTGGWSVRSAVFQLLGNKTVLANGTGISAFGGAPILLANERGYPLYNTYTREDGSWVFWDISAVDGTYYAYTVGLGEDWRIVVTNPTAVVTQVHYAARASSMASFG